MTGKIIHDPYADVDWDDVQTHKSEFHNHPIKDGDIDPHDAVDTYVDRGYTVFAIGDKGYEPMAWPWDEFSEIDSDYEDRDPEELGVVSFPGAEITGGESRPIDHLSSIFSTAVDNYVSLYNRHTAIGNLLDLADETGEPEGMVVLAHPIRYYDNPAFDWEQYVEDFSEYSLEDGLLGFEVFNNTSSFARSPGVDVTLWDELLSRFAPNRLIWGFGVDDPSPWIVGETVDVRWTEVLLDDDEFDPSDQGGSRRAAADAFREGRTFLVQRRRWDDDEKDPPETPTIDAIDVDDDEDTITIDASGYSTIEWISGGQVVGTEETIEVDDSLRRYVRGRLGTDDAELLTQPFGIEVAGSTVEEHHADRVRFPERFEAVHGSVETLRVDELRWGADETSIWREVATDEDGDADSPLDLFVPETEQGVYLLELEVTNHGEDDEIYARFGESDDENYYYTVKRFHEDGVDHVHERNQTALFLFDVGTDARAFTTATFKRVAKHNHATSLVPESIVTGHVPDQRGAQLEAGQYRSSSRQDELEVRSANDDGAVTGTVSRYLRV